MRAVSKIKLFGCVECVQPCWFEQMNEKIWDDVGKPVCRRVRCSDGCRAALRKQWARRAAKTHSDCSWFWLLWIDKFLSGHISCLSRYSHSLIQSGRPLLCVRASALAAARENQLQCVGIHNLASESTLLEFLVGIYIYEVYQGCYVTNLRLAINGVCLNMKCAAAVKNDIILQIDIASVFLAE